MTTESLTPGARLRQARAEKNLAVEYVAEQLRLTRQQIEALEGDDFSDASRLAYMRGHLRMYAKFLGIPQIEIVKAFEGLGLENKDTITQLPTTSLMDLGLKKSGTGAHASSARSASLWWSGGIILILIGLFFASFTWHTHHKVATAAVAPAKTNVIATPAQTQSIVINPNPVVTNPNDNGQPMALTIPPQPAPGEPVLTRANP